MNTKYLFFLTILFLNISPSYAVTDINRAKTLVRGAQMYRKQTLPRLYEFLEISGLGRSAQKLKSASELIEKTQEDIEINLQETMNSAEQSLRKTNKSSLERQQIFMNAKVLDEVNRLFNALDNIMSNLAKEVRDYRQIQKKLEPVVEKIKKEIKVLNETEKAIATKIQSYKKQFEPQLKKLKLDPLSTDFDKAFIKLAPEVVKLRTQLEPIKATIAQKKATKENLERQYIPTLQDYYETMEKDAKGLFNLAKKLGTSMSEKAGYEQSLVEQYQKNLDEQEAKFTNATLLKQLTEAQKNYISIMNDTQKEIANLSESEQRLWGILTDLYQRVLLTESIITKGPSSIQQWTLPRILGIKLPEEIK